MPLTIAQLSDVHLGFDRDVSVELNEDRLVAALAAVRALDPDLVVVSGDLTDAGELGDYERLRVALAPLPCSVRLTIGNHDVRANFFASFPDEPANDGFVQYALDLDGLRCIVLDTLEEGRNGGGFCADRAGWLAAALAQAPDTPTLIVLHHPPVAVGVAWMDPGPAEPWIARLAGALDGHGQIVGLAAGHVHAPSVSMWRGIPVTIAPSVAPAVALSLAPIEAERPDGRAMIVEDVPGFAVHRWADGRLTTHFGSVAGPVMARFGEGMQPLIRTMEAERAER